MFPKSQKLHQDQIGAVGRVSSSPWLVIGVEQRRMKVRHKEKSICSWTLSPGLWQKPKVNPPGGWVNSVGSHRKFKSNWVGRNCIMESV